MTEREVDDDMRREMNTLVAAYVLDALPSDERSAFETYLETATDAAHEVAELFATTAVLGATSAAVPPTALRARVLGAAAQTRQLPPLTRLDEGDPATAPADDSGETLLRRVSDGVERPAAADQRGGGRHVDPSLMPAQAGTDPGPDAVVPVDFAAHRRRRVGTRVAAAFAVAAVLALGVVVGVQHQRLSDARHQTTLAERQASTISRVAAQPDVRTRATQVAGGGRATVLVSATAGRGVVVLDGVAALPSAKTYELWLIDATGKARAVTTFGTQSTGATVPFGAIRAGDSVGVSVEPAGGSPTGAPTTKPVFAVPLV